MSALTIRVALSVLMIFATGLSEAQVLTPKDADRMLDQSYERMLGLIDLQFREGKLSELMRTLVLADLNAFRSAYKGYSSTAANTHTYLKTKQQRELHYVNKVLHMASRWDNFVMNPQRDLADITEEVTDFVPADGVCGTPVSLPCVAQEVERRMNVIYSNINRRPSSVRAKFKKVADQGLHAVELYSRVIATLRTDGGEAYPSEYIHAKDRLVMGVKQELEEGY